VEEDAALIAVDPSEPDLPQDFAASGTPHAQVAIRQERSVSAQAAAVVG